MNADDDGVLIRAKSFAIVDTDVVILLSGEDVLIYLCTEAIWSNSILTKNTNKVTQIKQTLTY